MIWVVTDHHPTRQELVPLIAAEGYEVSEVECGDELLKRIRFQRPVLVILDCGMRDSFETLETIRREQRGRPLPVVMFSTGGEDLKEKALLRGADAFVRKGSLDWAELLVEVVRFAGPPPGKRSV
jgi:CheY-like chemotaxis protein